MFSNVTPLDLQYSVVFDDASTGSDLYFFCTRPSELSVFVSKLGS